MLFFNIIFHLLPKKNLKLSSARRSRDFLGWLLASAGGEMRSDYFKNTVPELNFQG